MEALLNGGLFLCPDFFIFPVHSGDIVRFYSTIFKIDINLVKKTSV